MDTSDSFRILRKQILESLFHEAWLDEGTILLAGTSKDNQLCIAFVEVETGILNIVYEEEKKRHRLSSEENVDEASFLRPVIHSPKQCEQYISFFCLSDRRCQFLLNCFNPLSFFMIICSL